MRKIFGFYALPLHILFRPINGFYEMKFEKQGNLKIALLNFVLVCISFAFFNQYTSILVNESHPHWLNSLGDFFNIAAVLLLFCLSNWAVTSLTDGEGKFMEILMAICYAMTPLILTLIPAALLSNVITIDEAGFFHLLVGFGVLWFVVLVFVGLIVVHNYTVLKAISTIFLTAVALLIILFLITLFFTLVQQLVVFIQSLYREVSFRM